MGRLADARGDLDQLIKADARNGQALGLLSLVQWTIGENEKARDTIAKALEVQPDDAQLLNHQGVILNALNDFKGAIASLERAVKMEPDNPDSLFNLAALLVSHEPSRREEARRHYEAALRLGLSRDDRLEKRLYE
jgi:tetratricopeptide (TPR) repeat protein